MKKTTFPWMSFVLRGTGIGFPVTLTCMALIGGFNGVIAEFLTWMVASALFGLISGLLFHKANLNLLAATAIHFVCCLEVAASAGSICGYADSFLEVLMGILPVFVIVYVVIYGCIFLSMKREEKRINQALKQE